MDEAEVVKGYSRTADYTRKTQALAEERKRFGAEEVEPTRAARLEYLERLQALDAVIPNPGREPDWDKIRNELTPEEFTQQFGEWKAWQGRYKRVQEERERVLADAMKDEERTMAARLKREHAMLQEAIPEFKDPEKAKEKRADLVAYAKSLGFTADNLANVTDHRLLVLLEDSRKYRESQKRKPKIEDTIDRALDTLRPSATKSKPKTSEVERLHGNLRKSGTVDDAAALLAKILP